MNTYIIVFFSFIFLSLAKVDPPNYQFRLEILDSFLPGKNLNEIPERWGKAQEISKKGKYQVSLFYIRDLRYKFPIYVQSQDNQIMDFQARLPSYFLHDIFHQSLINRYGKQDFYLNRNEHAVYIWKNENSNRHVYAGACSITCYPIYYAVMPNKESWLGGYTPIIEQFLIEEKALR